MVPPNQRSWAGELACPLPKVSHVALLSMAVLASAATSRAPASFQPWGMSSLASGPCVSINAQWSSHAPKLSINVVADHSECSVQVVDAAILLDNGERLPAVHLGRRVWVAQGQNKVIEVVFERGGHHWPEPVERGVVMVQLAVNGVRQAQQYHRARR